MGKKEKKIAKLVDSLLKRRKKCININVFNMVEPDLIGEAGMMQKPAAGMIPKKAKPTTAQAGLNAAAEAEKTVKSINRGPGSVNSGRRVPKDVPVEINAKGITAAELGINQHGFLMGPQ
ncbi:hypothetical protein JOC77_001175 [Peribacillus deserti]|uniref:Uncharacterized protein n=1 Tax=Peribacillus deserti TaxID=673318 RepID=A0ABS2QF57_9BACI|nr:hypothetical protein [Peribacillus deserti]MBM7691768.1 hypothetical protein [Peribacillus deserti]